MVFFKKKQAIEHFLWLAERPETEPVYGFYREVYRRLARLYDASGQHKAAQSWRRRSGYDGVEPHTPIMGWFTTGLEGTTMAPTPVLEEVVKDRVFSLYGFGFSDIHFVVSDDKRSLIAIDAGTQPRWLEAAHAYLLQARTDLPDIQAAFITHAHWDHIGGHAYLRQHNPGVAIYGRDNYRAVTERVLREHRYEFFRGQDFDPDWVRGYAPTHPISDAQAIIIGETEFSLIPVSGGETEDAMLIHIPSLDCVFVGDVVMPWYGEPWVNEGFATTASDTMDQVLALGATHILHGHHPLTALYGRDTLAAYRDMHIWLVRATQSFVTHGYSAKDIIRLNLIPPHLADHPDATLAYVAARDNVIARVAQDMVGIWREDQTGQSPEGLDTISTTERARLLSEYLGLSEAQTVRMLDRILKGGDHALAPQYAVAAERAFGPTVQITRAKQRAADALRGAAQFLDPFAFTVLSEMTDRPQPRMGDTPTPGTDGAAQ